MVEVMMRKIGIEASHHHNSALIVSDHEEASTVWGFDELIEVFESFIDKGIDMDTTQVIMTGRAAKAMCKWAKQNG